MIRDVAADRVDRSVFVAVFAVVGFGDSILLPFDYTQRISFANWHYFDARYVAFTVAFALAIAWVITLQVHATRRVLGASRRSRTTTTTTGSGIPAIVATVVSLLPSFLCCSPIVPTLVGLLGLSATTQLRTTGAIQYFFATQQDLLLLGALALVIGSGLWSTRKLARATCLTDQCRTGADEPVAGRGDAIDGASSPERQLADATAPVAATSRVQGGGR